MIFLSPGPSIDHSIVLALRFDRCFIQFGNDTVDDDSDGSTSAEKQLAHDVATFEGDVTFENNNATINGDAIFVTSLNACNISSKGILYPDHLML